MLRTGISTNEAVAKALKDHNTPLSYGATPDKWKEALTTISGEDETIKPREIEKVTGFMSNNETILKTLNSEIKESDDKTGKDLEDTNTTEKVTVNMYFTKDGLNVELDEAPTLGGVVGTLEDDHYTFEVNTSDEDVELKYTYDGVEASSMKSITADLDDVIVIG